MVRYTSPANSAISDTPPSESDGKVWVDTSQDPPEMKLYDTATGAFIPASAKSTIVSQSEPTPEQGKIWFEPVENGTNMYAASSGGWGFLEFVSEIPASVVSRPDDDNTNSDTDDYGVRIEVDEQWPKIQARIGSLVSGQTRAYIYRVNDGTLLADTDISGLSAGDVYTLEDVNLQPHDSTDATRYNLTLDAEGGSYTRTRYKSGSFPYTSSDGKLRIVNGANEATGTLSNPYNIEEVGNINL